MNLGHPALKDMVTLGCKNQSKILLAFQTYMELCEVMKVQNVDYFYNSELDLIYLVALYNDKEETYISLSVNDGISPKKIQSYYRALGKDCLNIAVRDVDSSCVIYKINKGLQIPTSLENSKEKRESREKQELLEAEINNLIPSLIQEARSKPGDSSLE